MAKIDTYIKNVIGLGDEGSELLAKLTAPTLKNSEFVDVLQEGMNGLVVLRIPDNHVVAVHSIGGDPHETDLASHSASLVDRLVEQAKTEGLTPVAFSNVVDAREGLSEHIKIIGDALVSKADEYRLSINNGELAILGERVNCIANISGTMISIAEKKDFSYLSLPETIIRRKNSPHSFVVFDPEGKAVYINSDGIGTKTEFYERSRDYSLGIEDFMAMNLDDAIKMGAIVHAISGVCETTNGIPFYDIEIHTSKLAKKMGFLGILQHENVGKRIRSYEEFRPSYNISGSVVSTIDEEILRDPPKPGPGEYLIVIRGKPNPRSNGITDKRRLMIKLFGEDWHGTEEGKLFLKYLAQPSTILYPVFKKLFEKGAATSFYHMSGGAFNGKLAKPLAKHGLYVKLNNLFNPDYRELALSGAGFTSAETAYSKWPMGNDGFVTTKDPSKTINMIKKAGLEARVVGQLEISERPGVELEGIKTSNGKNIYYPGK